MKPLPQEEQERIDAAFLRASRTTALTEQENRCAYCRDPLTRKSATTDHVHPRARGGTDRRENVLAACGPCNRLKGDMPVSLFVKLIKNPAGAPIRFYYAWLRRKLNLRIERAERRVLSFGFNLSGRRG